MSIASRIELLRSQLPERVKLVAVSKFHPAEAIKEAYQSGQRIFGESRAQEMKAKQKELPDDIEWHFIGPLQSNKVKDIAPFVHTIHSIDSPKLLHEVNKQAAKQNRTIRVLLEIHVAQEESKHGFTPEEIKELLHETNLSIFPNIKICGLMGMATFTDNETQVRAEFRVLARLFGELKDTFFKESNDFVELSMGMTDDYNIAIEEGSTMIRIGSYIFGQREY